MTNERVPVDFYYDPMCPFAWATSRWILEAAKVRPLDVSFKMMSLSVLNEGRDLGAKYNALMANGWGPVRIAVNVEPMRQEAFYTALGTLHHVEKHHLDKETVAKALAQAGIDEQVIEAYDDASQDDAVRKSHHTGMDPVGDEVGTPVLHFDGAAYFGPVITRISKGEEAGELWDHIRGMGKFPYFFELKRTRTEDPQAS